MMSDFFLRFGYLKRSIKEGRLAGSAPLTIAFLSTSLCAHNSSSTDSSNNLLFSRATARRFSLASSVLPLVSNHLTDSGINL